MARMDKVEARALLDQKVRELRQLSYAELQRFQEPVVFELTGPSGAWYQIEVEALWDDRRDNNLRVLAAIDDGGCSAIHVGVDVPVAGGGRGTAGSATPSWLDDSR